MNISPQISNFLVNIKNILSHDFPNTESYAFLNALPDDSKICIACSGGSDSVFLTLLFCAYFPHLMTSASILHLNHNLRGQEADHDESYVKQLAQTLKLNFISGKLKKSDTFLSEEKLREIRYKFFQTQMDILDSKILLLGQQKNDIAETLIMRLSRASGLEGLSAPFEVRKFINDQIRVRPLLFIKKEKIESILAQFEIPWRVDSSNLHCYYFRNKVRNVILKDIQESAKQYDIITNFAESQKQIKEANDAIEILSNHYLRNENFNITIDWSDYKNLPAAIIRRILNKWLLHNNLSIKREKFEELLYCIQSGETKIFNCLNGHRIKLQNNILNILSDFSDINKIKYSISWTNEEIFFPNGKILRKEKINIDEKYLQRIKQCEVSAEAYINYYPNALKISNFNPDENYARFGHKTPKKLKEIINKNIAYFQDSPMIYIETDICWVPGLPITDKFKIKEGTKYALLLTYS